MMGDRQGPLGCAPAPLPARRPGRAEPVPGLGSPGAEWREGGREKGPWGCAPAPAQPRPGRQDKGTHRCPLPPAEDRSNAYFVVAVVKRNSSNAFSLNELRGKRSCHSALGSPAGWDIPVGALVRRGFIQPRDCDVLTGATLRGTQSLLGVGWGPGPSPPGTHRRQRRGFLFLRDGVPGGSVGAGA